MKIISKTIIFCLLFIFSITEVLCIDFNFEQINIPLNYYSLYHIFNLNNNNFLLKINTNKENSNLYFSEDNGIHWTLTNSNFITYNNTFIYTLNNGDIICGPAKYISNNDSVIGIFLSNDLGKTWNNILLIDDTDFDPTNNNFIFHHISVNSKNEIFVASITKGLFISNDYGIHFKNIDNDTTKASYIFTNPITDNLFLCNSFLLYKSTNNGNSWLIKSIFNNYVPIIISNIDKKGNIFGDPLVPTEAVCKSTDDGESWVPLEKDFSDNPISMILPYNHYIFVVCYNGLQYSSNDGITWEYVSLPPNDFTLYGNQQNDVSYVSISDNGDILILRHNAELWRGKIPPDAVNDNENSSKNEIIINPQPAKDILHLSCINKENISTINIVDLFGNLCYNRDINKYGWVNSISISDLNSGLYFLESTFRDGNKSINKFIVYK
ncbi:MAG: T9SS type A sorting domain-containing protein [FCB group bacterium]